MVVSPVYKKSRWHIWYASATTTSTIEPIKPEWWRIIFWRKPPVTLCIPKRIVPLQRAYSFRWNTKVWFLTVTRTVDRVGWKWVDDCVRR